MRMVLKWTRKVLKWLRKVLKFLTPPQSNYALLYISPPIRTQQTPNHSHLSINRSICVYRSTLKFLYARPKMMLLPVLDFKIGLVKGEIWKNHWMKTIEPSFFDQGCCYSLKPNYIPMTWWNQRLMYGSWSKVSLKEAISTPNRQQNTLPSTQSIKATDLTMLMFGCPDFSVSPLGQGRSSRQHHTHLCSCKL